jgi:hypothetical protein
MEEDYYRFDMEQRSKIQTYERNDNLSFQDKYASYHLVENDTSGAFTDTVAGVAESSPLTDAYFSKRNIEYLQQQIIKQIKIQSSGKYVIGRQNANELIVIMRSMFLQFQENLYIVHPTEIKKYVDIEIEHLNKRVLDYTVPHIINSIEQYLESMRIRRQGVLPLDRAVNTSVQGTRTNNLNNYYSDISTPY